MTLWPDLGEDRETKKYSFVQKDGTEIEISISWTLDKCGCCHSAYGPLILDDGTDEIMHDEDIGSWKGFLALEEIFDRLQYLEGVVERIEDQIPMSIEDFIQDI